MKLDVCYIIVLIISINVVRYIKMTVADDARCGYRALGHHGRTRRNVSWKTA